MTEPVVVGAVLGFLSCTVTECRAGEGGWI